LSKKKVLMQKIAGLCGIIGPLVALSFITLAISYSLSWFSWTENALSDLAGPQATTTAASIFNSGLIIGGLLSIIFAAGLMRALYKPILGYVGTFVLILADASLVAIGIFPETAGSIHSYVSIVFFTLFPISLLFIGASMIKEKIERILGFATILFGIFAAASIATVIVLPMKGVAIPELLASLSGSAWSIVCGIKLYKRSVLS
jgi:hypothetical membrane protein